MDVSKVREYDAARDARAVQELWQATLGGTYPVTERVFRGCTTGRPSYEPGDALVAVEGRRIVGFGMIEPDRHAAGVGACGSVAALLVHPAHQRHGVGTRLLAELEARLRAQGCTQAQVGGGLNRFWTGCPADLPAGLAFFLRQGYALKGGCYDLVIPLEPYTDAAACQAKLAAAGVELVGCTPADLGAALAFETREFAGWVAATLRMAGAGDLGNFLVLKRGGQIIGSIQTYTPGSRWRAANLIWEGVLGPRLGGFGAVGIAKDCRGQGLGKLMCEGAAHHVKRAGADQCHIDWTGLVGFYAKVGAKVWREFHRGTRALA